MATYHPATFGAMPLCFFLFQKPLDAMLFDKFEILNHAHMVKSAVALVESLQPAAGEIFTIIAKPHKSFPQQFTLPFVVTIPAAW
jgi:hypothetical protein